MGGEGEDAFPPAAVGMHRDDSEVGMKSVGARGWSKGAVSYQKAKARSDIVAPLSGLWTRLYIGSR